MVLFTEGYIDGLFVPDVPDFQDFMYKDVGDFEKESILATLVN